MLILTSADLAVDAQYLFACPQKVSGNFFLWPFLYLYTLCVSFDVKITLPFLLSSILTAKIHVERA